MHGNFVRKLGLGSTARYQRLGDHGKNDGKKSARHHDLDQSQTPAIYSKLASQFLVWSGSCRLRTARRWYAWPALLHLFW